jgi:hypothetical protein
LTRTYLRFGLTQLGIYVIMFGLTQWVEAARGLSAYEAGLMLIPMGVLSAVTARVVSRRTDIRKPLLAAAVFMLLGSVAALRTFGYVGSIASATITGVVFRGGVDDAGLRHVSLILTGIGVVVLLMTVLDRHLAGAGGEPGHSGRAARGR